MTTSPSVLDSSEFLRRVAGLRALGLGFAIVLTGVTIGFWMVVHFALDGVPLAGNLYKLAGVPVPTWIAGTVALATPFAALAAGRLRARTGLRHVAAAHPELAGSSEEVETLVDVFAAVIATEYAVAFGSGFACALLFHITTDPVILGGVGLQAGFLLVRRPTVERARAWVVRSADTVARLRARR